MATQTAHYHLIKPESADRVAIGNINDNSDTIDGHLYKANERADQLADDYNPSSTYNTDDYVRRENYLYKCLEDNVTGTWDDTKWDRVKVMDEISQGGGGGSSTLAGLDDVSLATPTDGQLLGYNGTSHKWENVNGGGGGSSTFAGLNDVDVAGVDNKDIARFNSSTNKWEKSSDLTTLELAVSQISASTLGITEGHTILDSNGTAMAQEDGLQFASGYVEDDPVKGKTIYIEMIRISQANYNTLKANGQLKPGAKYFIYDAQPVAIDASNLPYSSTQSTKQKIDEVASSDVTELIFTPVSTVAVSSSNIKRDGRVKMCLLRLDITNISNNTETKIGELSGFISGQYYVSGAVVSAYNTRTVGSFVLSGNNLFCRLLSDATASEKSNVSISIYLIN